MNTSMIKIEGLTFKYGKRASVFQDFSLEMEAGKVIGLLGKNGTGKSTLLYLLSGLLRPQAGHLYFRGADVQKRLPQSLADMYLVPEEFTLPNLSLNQFVRLNASFYPRFSREILRNCLEDFGLNEDIHLGELSMGQKKKAYMCFALAANTSLLLMDEPFSALDAQTRTIMQEELVTLWEKTRLTTLYVTHNIQEAVMLADRVVLLSRRPGKVSKILQIVLPRAERAKPEHTDEISEFVRIIWEHISKDARDALMEVEDNA